MNLLTCADSVLVHLPFSNNSITIATISPMRQLHISSKMTLADTDVAFPSQKHPLGRSLMHCTPDQTSAGSYSHKFARTINVLRLAALLDVPTSTHVYVCQKHERHRAATRRSAQDRQTDHPLRHKDTSSDTGTSMYILYTVYILYTFGTRATRRKAMHRPPRHSSIVPRTRLERHLHSPIQPIEQNSIEVSQRCAGVKGPIVVTSAESMTDEQMPVVPISVVPMPVMPIPLGPELRMSEGYSPYEVQGCNAT